MSRPVSTGTVLVCRYCAQCEPTGLTIRADGPWSSFALQMGNHAQDIRAMISTAATFTWGIQASGCPDFYPANCEDSRGFFFLTNESITWQGNSVYQFGLETNLGYDSSGQQGWDDVSIGWQGAVTATVNHSVVYVIQDSKYWLGGFGLNPRPTNFTTLTEPQPSFLTQLKATNQTPSISYGYTAGNQYRLDKVFGSLTLGGYDQNRFTPTNVTFPFYQDISRDLLVNIQSITVDKGSPSNLLPDGSIAAFVDSTTPWLWLPESACKAFEQAFNLTYNEDYGLYLVDNALHTTLSNTDASVTFTLGPQTAGGETVDIVLPYGAFDLQIDFPYIENPNSSYYFPLMRAANDTQYTLGRTFLQEAYLIADYERENFTIAPCAWTNTSVAELKSIISPNETSIATGSGSGGGLSAGAIAGVVVGIVAVIAILGLILWLLRRRKVAEKKRVAELEASERTGAGKHSDDSNNEQKPFISDPIGGELGGGEIHELNAPYAQRAAEMESPYKMDPNKHGYSEMEGGEYFGPGKNFAHEMQGSHHPIYEMAGSDVHEMPTSEHPADKPK